MTAWRLRRPTEGSAVSQAWLASGAVHRSVVEGQTLVASTIAVRAGKTSSITRYQSPRDTLGEVRKNLRLDESGALFEP
jgi:hypothetical protein